MGCEIELLVRSLKLPFGLDECTALDWLNCGPEHLLRYSSLVVVDSYLVTSDWLRRLRKSGAKVVHLDDYNRMIYPVDLIINPNVFAQDLDYSNQYAPWIGGADYVIIRSPFRKSRSFLVDTVLPRLFVTVGGSDFRGLLPKLADWAVQTNLYEVRILDPVDSSNLPGSVTKLPLLQEDEMAAEMTRSDVIITACGQTLHEAVVLRKPTIGIGLDKDQEPNHRYYNQAGYIQHNIWWNQPDLENIVKFELNRLASFSERQRSVAKAPSINPNGVEKVASAIIDLFDEF